MTTVNSQIITNLSNMNTFGDFIRGANASGAGYFFTAVNFMIFLILFITMSVTFGWESAFLSAGFVSILLSILFVYMGVMNFWIAGLFVGALLVMIIYIAWSNKYD